MTFTLHVFGHSTPTVLLPDFRGLHRLSFDAS